MLKNPRRPCSKDFIACEMDELNECWLEDRPPTYQEFTIMWKTDYVRRQPSGSTSKEEGAFINFTQNFIKMNFSILKEYRA